LLLSPRRIIVSKANLRLKKPSSHTPLVSRVGFWDIAWGSLSPLAAFLLRDGTIYAPSAVAVYCGVAFFASLLVFQWFQTSSPIARFYSLRDAFELFKACVLVAALSAGAVFVLTRLDEAPRSIPVLHLMLLASGLLGARILLRLWNTRRDTRIPDAAKKVEYVLLIGASRLAWFFTKMVEELAPGRYQIVAILDERPELKHRSLNGYPIIGTSADIEKVIADYAMHGVRIDKIVLAAQPDEMPTSSMAEVSRVSRTLHIGLEFLPKRLMLDETEGDEGGVIVPLPSAISKAAEDSLQIALDAPYWTVKRGIDLVVALFAAIVLSPVILVVCTLVLLDVGIPVVFWQRRVGRNGMPLHLYKFRTLQTLFDRQTKERREAQQPSAVSRFLQRTRFDELPQLWNIISGEMSLIGPRPLLPVDQPDGYPARLLVRPGLTGWAQIGGGKLISVAEKKALDEWYIRNASLWLDLKIVLRTIRMLLVTGDRRDEKAIAVALADSLDAEAAGAPEATAPGIADEPAPRVARATSRLS
jgi:lipopolysaccharide/colanic/teichoic acid biosynthesis glycosyltransferase